jgi:hypothetical protein
MATNESARGGSRRRVARVESQSPPSPTGFVGRIWAVWP